MKAEFSEAVLTFDNKALNSIAAQSTESIKITVEKVADMNGRPAFTFSIKSGANEISDFGGGTVTIIIPYELKANESADSIVVYYVDNNGGLKVVRGKYNAELKAVEIKLKHFSTYVIGYNKVDFKDVSTGQWYAQAIEFIAARGITSGIGNGKYGPGNIVTRGQFIKMLCDAYGIAPVNGGDNFKDAGNTWYTPYLAAAKQAGISSGTGNNLFAPENVITRQEMFVLIYNTAKMLNELPVGQGKNLSDFKDVVKIDRWAVEAIEYFVKNGAVSGANGNIDPRGNADRAQMAQMFYNLLK